MIHTKSLIRRLDCIPWLLTIGLVLGWAGESTAQIAGTGYTVLLTLDEPELRIRENAGKTPVKVTATIIGQNGTALTGDAAKVSPEGGLQVQLSFSPKATWDAAAADNSLRNRFSVGTERTITIAAEAASGSMEVEITPAQSDGATENVDIFITIEGQLIGAQGSVVNDDVDTAP